MDHPKKTPSVKKIYKFQISVAILMLGGRRWDAAETLRGRFGDFAGMILDTLEMLLGPAFLGCYCDNDKMLQGHCRDAPGRKVNLNLFVCLFQWCDEGYQGFPQFA